MRIQSDIMLVRQGKEAYTALRNNVVRIALAEAGTLQEVHYVGFASALLVQAIFILLETDGSAKNNFLPACRETVVTVVENDFNYFEKRG